jgi:hypothetical protein
MLTGSTLLAADRKLLFDCMQREFSKFTTKSINEEASYTLGNKY